MVLDNEVSIIILIINDKYLSCNILGGPYELVS